MNRRNFISKALTLGAALCTAPVLAHNLGQNAPAKVNSDLVQIYLIPRNPITGVFGDEVLIPFRDVKKGDYTREYRGPYQFSMIRKATSDAYEVEALDNGHTIKTWCFEYYD